ncbi:MAG: transposase [Flavobacterium sp.]
MFLVVQKKPPFSYQSQGLAETILADIAAFSKPVKKFLSTLFSQWFSISGRYNFVNMARYMNYNEQSLRNGFERGVNFFVINQKIIQNHNPQELVLAFDPTFIPKSGKHTCGLDLFWNGKEQRVKKGLELGCLAAIDVDNQTALHLEAIQTPHAAQRAKNKSNLIEHYRNFLLQRIDALKQISSYLAVDGYFMKKDFILPLVNQGIHVITKMRPDANLKYLFRGKQKKGRGRTRKFGDKVNLKKLDLKKWEKITSDKNELIYTSEVYCVTLKRNVRVVYLRHVNGKGYTILLSTEVGLSAIKIVAYYRLRFQIEFLIRDAKQHGGLQDCQSRGSKKMGFHFNMALTSVSLAKAEYYLIVAKEKRGAFSIQDIKRQQQNKTLAHLIFCNLDIDLSCKKIRRIYEKCCNWGRIAA